MSTLDNAPLDVQHAIAGIVQTHRLDGVSRPVAMSRGGLHFLVEGEHTSNAAKAIGFCRDGALGRWVDSQLGGAKGTAYENFQRFQLGYRVLDELGVSEDPPVQQGRHARWA